MEQRAFIPHTNGQALCPDCNAVFCVWSHEVECPHGPKSYAPPAFAPQLQQDLVRVRPADGDPGKAVMCCRCYEVYTLLEQSDACPHEPNEPVRESLGRVVAYACLAIIVCSTLVWLGAAGERHRLLKAQQSAPLVIGTGPTTTEMTCESGYVVVGDQSGVYTCRKVDSIPVLAPSR